MKKFDCQQKLTKKRSRETSTHDLLVREGGLRMTRSGFNRRVINGVTNPDLSNGEVRT
jgi:hypothetical protein